MRKLILLLLICQYTLGQITLTPNSVGMNAAAENNVLTAQGNGLLIQEKFTLSTADPNSTVISMGCPSGNINNSQAGILKDPYGDSPYLGGIVHNCTQYVYNSSPMQAFLITFTQLDLGTGDTIIFDSGFRKLKFTGNTLPMPFLITFTYLIPVNSNGFSINFKTNSDGDVGQGFAFRYQGIPSLSPEIENPNNFLGGKSMFFNSTNGSIAAGLISSNEPRGKYSVGLGYLPLSEGYGSTSIGFANRAIGSFSISMGEYNSSISPNSVTIGEKNLSLGYGSHTIGSHLISKSYRGIVLGTYNNDADSPSAVGTLQTDRIFQIGNGDFPIRRNALTILRNGNVGFGNTAETLAPDSRLVIDGFTRLGIDAPKIKMKEITGNMPALNANNTYAHGLIDAKILSITISAEVNNQFIPPNYSGNPTLEYNYYWTAGNLYILNKNGNSAGLAGVPFKALITYKD